MRRISTLLRALPVLALLALPPAGRAAGKDAAAKDALFQTIASLDAALFEAFNRCDLEKFGALLADDLEFYHDLDGLSRTRQSAVESLRKHICGKVRRELVPGTLEVHPIAGYGAVQLGVHRFQHPGTTDDTPGEAKFVHVWANKDGAWKLARVISYDHHALPK
jgi:ketosteroid isomerase-like protein